MKVKPKRMPKASAIRAQRKKIKQKKIFQKKRFAGVRTPRDVILIKKDHDGRLVKPGENPILSPRREHDWEAYQTFNPAAIFEGGKVQLLYRALGSDGVSRLGHAESTDGITIDFRSDKPVFICGRRPEKDSAVSYEAMQYISGGGCGGCEDPRLTVIGDTVYMVYVSFDGWSPPRIALTSIKLDDFLAKRWKWAGSKIISPPDVIDKSGCLFPEIIRGKYVILHRIFPNILLDYVDDLEFKHGTHLKGEYTIPVRKNKWDSRKIGAGAPPLKTKYGWLLIYYAVDNKDASQYKIGAMLLDLTHPERVIARSDAPILEPAEWYENAGHKAGVAYPCGAVVMNGTLFVYYGGADTVVCVGTANLDTFIEALMKSKTPKLKKHKSKMK